MVLAVTHVLTAIILVDLYRDYVTKNKKHFTLHTILFAGIGGLLPDIDVPLNWLLSLLGPVPEFMQHGGMTHTPFFAVLLAFPGIWLLRKGKHRRAGYSFALAFGAMVHIALDLVLGGGAYEGIMLFFPFSTLAFKIHLLSYLQVPNIPEGIDAVILLAWLWHEEAKHKISDFI